MLQVFLLLYYINRNQYQSLKKISKNIYLFSIPFLIKYKINQELRGDLTGGGGGFGCNFN